MFMLITALQSDGLTLDEVVHDIPHDARAVFVYVLLLVFVGLIWYGSRKQKT